MLNLTLTPPQYAAAVFLLRTSVYTSPRESRARGERFDSIERTLEIRDAGATAATLARLAPEYPSRAMHIREIMDTLILETLTR
jgi:hypothetical protein